MKVLYLLLTLSLLPIVSYANEEYRIESEIYNNGNYIGNPIIVTNANEESSIEEPNKYQLSVLPKNNNDLSVTLDTSLNIMKKEISPIFVLNLNEWASVSSNNILLKIRITKNKENKENADDD